MTVSDFAVCIYGAGIIKDHVKIIRDGEVLYEDRMEFLHYADEYNPEKIWFAGAEIQGLRMEATHNVREIDFNSDYYIVIVI